MALMVKTAPFEGAKTSFLVISLSLLSDNGYPKPGLVYVAEDLEEDTVVAVSISRQAGFDGHLRWRIGASRWTNGAEVP